jgi:hypothetical protein
MDTKSGQGREIKIPGPDHPITVSPVEGKRRAKRSMCSSIAHTNS